MQSTVIGEKLFNSENREKRMIMLKKLAMLPLGALLSSATLVGGLAPFGAAFIAAVPRGSIIFAAIGSVIGFVFSHGINGLLRCAATALAVAGIRWALAELRGISKSPAFPPLAALFAVVATGMTVSISNGSALMYDILPYIAEGLLAAAAAFFLAGAFKALEGRPVEAGTNALCCLCVSALICAIPLCSLEIFGFAPFCVLLLAAVPVAASRFGLTGGSIAGAAAGAALALSGGRLELAGALSLAGVLCALFMRFGRLAGALTFAVACALGSVISGDINVFFMAEAALGSILFIAIPQIWLERLFNLISHHFPIGEKNGSASVFTGAPGAADCGERLLRAAEGLDGVCETVSAVSERLEKLDEPSMELVYRRACEKICEGCAIKKHCFGEGKEALWTALCSLSDTLGEDGGLNGQNVPETVKSRCARWGELMQEINLRYADFEARRSAKRRVAQVRSVVSEQLGGVSELLTELAEPPEKNAELCKSFEEGLREYGYLCADTSCCRDRDGAVTASARVLSRSRTALSRSELAEALGEDMDINFLPATLESIPGGGFNITLRSRPPYRVAFYASQRAKNEAVLCGDAYEALCADGAALFILSDGMGSGGRAAVDGAMACGLTARLLKAGFGVSGALRIVNSALLTKSDDESLSTIDCLRISLYSGEAELCKAGAACSYIIHKGELRSADLPSLPLGIMRKPDCAVGREMLCPGDTVIMTSDGVAPELFDDMTDMIRRFDASQSRALCEHLCSAAAAESNDDVTVLVMTLLPADTAASMREAS